MINDDEIPKHRSKKNTRKWCKGKEDKPHEPVWEKSRKHNFYNTSIWLVYACQNCGKQLDSYYEFLNENGVNFWLSDAKYYERPEIGSTEPLKKKEC